MPAHLSLPQAGGGQEEWEEPSLRDSAPGGLTLAEVEKRHILRTLARCDGNRTRAAAALGIGRNTLARKLKAYGLADDD
jgi:Nif-specific regulatory protein